jgi:hypothetical protein
MGKDTYYFSHDYNARTDEKIKLLIRKHGLIGYGIFWAIVEDLYNNANALRTDYDGIAFELRTDVELIKSVINDFNLFQIEGDIFGSLSVQNRLNQRLGKSKSARQSALIRWSKSETDANALQTQSEGNAIKERKVKEKKDIKPSKIPFEKSIIFDKHKFAEKFEGWNKTKLEYYYNAAISYSIEGNKYVNWESAIRNWAKRDELQGKLKFEDKNQTEETETEYRRRTWLERNGGI